ncbi:MAG: rod shape-determining protein RodA [Cyclobacteriaceae bacterium]|nr:rod shape-determining protein RodA [Cyclobacteriaceae bacterium]
MTRSGTIFNNIDWLVVLVYGIMVVFGWLNIYASEYDPLSTESIFSLSSSAGKQLIFIGLSLLSIIIITVVDDKLFESLAYPIWIFFVLMLILVLFVAREVNGARSWIEIGAFRFQPAEFTKFATALAVAKFASRSSFKMGKVKDLGILALLVGVPTLLIIAQGDMGTALVFSVFIIVLFREGLSAWPLVMGLLMAIIFLLALLVPDHLYLWIGTGVLAALLIVFNRKSVKRIAVIIIMAIIVSAMFEGVDYAFNSFLKPHQQNRILVLLNPNIDPLGVGWNVTQSKIAIGSGGVAGKGYLQGTQTTFDFVPEQSTDFIFCTLGEEQGWLGTTFVIFLFVFLLIRIVHIAERQKETFARVYGYSVASIIFIHFLINIGMTIGLFPVIGIPLPLFSYGGSSLWAFTILLFILLKIDAHRMQVLIR